MSGEKKDKKESVGGDKEITKRSHNKGKNSKKGKEKNRKEENEHKTRREMRLGQCIEKEDMYQSTQNQSFCQKKNPQEYLTGTEGLSTQSCASKGQPATSTGARAGLHRCLPEGSPWPHSCPHHSVPCRDLMGEQIQSSCPWCCQK